MLTAELEVVAGRLRKLAHEVANGAHQGVPLVSLLRIAADTSMPAGTMNGPWLLRQHAAAALRLTCHPSAGAAVAEWDRHPDRTRQDRARALEATAARILSNARKAPR